MDARSRRRRRPNYLARKSASAGTLVFPYLEIALGPARRGMNFDRSVRFGNFSAAYAPRLA